MTSILLDEGRRLARPVTHLVPAGPKARSGTAVGVWPATHVHDVAVPLDPFSDAEELWIQVDFGDVLDVLPADPRSGDVLEVYVDVGKGVGRSRFVDRCAEVRSGDVELVAVPALELPPSSELFRLGGAAVQEWLMKMGCEPFRRPALTALSDPGPLNEYERIWWQEHPLSTQKIHAQIGGWQVGWPDDGVDVIERWQLVLRTYQDSEPVVEVLASPEGELVVLPRVT